MQLPTYNKRILKTALESAPYDNSSLRSVYHVRNVDIYRMKCLSKSNTRVDIIASHDWPVGIEQHGNTQELIRRKPFFRQEIEQNNLGSPPNREVLDAVKPSYWFSAHLHVKFIAQVDHLKNQEGMDVKMGSDPSSHLVPSQVRTKTVPASPRKQNFTSGEGQDDSAASDACHSDLLLESKKPIEEASQESGHTQQTTFHGLESTCNPVNDLAEQMTRFLALDKCLPRRKYLSILHVEVPDEARNGATLEFDPEWLAVLRKTHHLNSRQQGNVPLPEHVVEVSTEDIEWVEERLKEKNSRSGDESASSHRVISTDFLATVPFYSDAMFQSRNMCPPFLAMGNPQTDFLLDVLELNHTITHPYDQLLTPQKISESICGYNETQNFPSVADEDENEIVLDVDDENGVVDENEIEIEDSDKEDDDTTHADPPKPCTAEEAVTKKPRIDG